MKNWSLAKRLWGSFGVVLALVLVIGVLGMRNTSSVASQSESMFTNDVSSVKDIAYANMAVLNMSRFMLRLTLVAGDSAAREATKAKVMGFDQDFRQYWNKFKASEMAAEERALAQKVDEDYATYVSVRQKAITLIEAGDMEAANALAATAGNNAFQSLNKHLNEALELNVRLSGETNADIQSAANSTVVVNAVLVLLAFGFGSVAAYVTVRATTQSLQQAVTVANNITQGDLTARIDTTRQDEVGLLLQAMARMQDSLVHVVSKVRSGSDSVANASAEIASGNQDLSGRTENQASALQQTATSMAELGSTVRQNADSASQANQLAQNASSVAMQGGEVVSKVVETMKDIHTSSQKIADIIGVIDGIAFQTNILALNAAVEAARAGEQGRGFAVVATEVRALAGRSAEAAKEIKTLIGSSVEKVEQGSMQVDQAGQIMQDVVGSIRRVTDIVAEISAASAEQSAGVGQVGAAIGSIDQTTQQNAALVEEMAAAASSLKGQAHELVQAVAVFKLHAHDASLQDAAQASPRPSFTAQPPAKPVGNVVANAVAPSRTPSLAKAVPKPAAAPKPTAALPLAKPSAKPAAKPATEDDWETF